MMSVVRGVRGATTVEQDDAASIVEATKELIVAMVQANVLLYHGDARSDRGVSGEGGSRGRRLGLRPADVCGGNECAGQPAALHSHSAACEHDPVADGHPTHVSAQCHRPSS